MLQPTEEGKGMKREFIIIFLNEAKCSHYDIEEAIFFCNVDHDCNKPIVT